MLKLMLQYFGHVSLFTGQDPDAWTDWRSNQSILKEISQIFIGRTDAKVEVPILWPTYAKN